MAINQPDRFQYRTLLFDFGNVILDIDYAGAHSRFNTLLREDADRNKIDTVLEKFETGKVSTEIFLNTVISQCRREIQAYDILEAWNSMLIGIPKYRLELLQVLREKYNVYLLSNTNAVHIEWVDRYMRRIYQVQDFEHEYFDEAFYSHIVGFRKPDPAFYQHVIREAFVEPAHALFMDDTKANIEAASALGFQTYWIQPGEEVAEVLKVKGLY
jgi:putative hydrolase of the HAD superfamily